MSLHISDKDLWKFPESVRQAYAAQVGADLAPEEDGSIERGPLRPRRRDTGNAAKPGPDWMGQLLVAFLVLVATPFVVMGLAFLACVAHKLMIAPFLQ